MKLKRILETIKKVLGKKEEVSVDTQQQLKSRLEEEIRMAHNELETLRLEYDYVEDPAAIDSVIYKIKAAESKHSMLLKQYRSIA